MADYPHPAIALEEPRLLRVLAMMERQPALTVADLARTICISPDHLERLFKHETGRLLHEVMAESRLQKAACLLATTDFPVKQVGFLVGYTHTSSFVRAFERRFAASPRQYRRKIAS